MNLATLLQIKEARRANQYYLVNYRYKPENDKIIFPLRDKEHYLLSLEMVRISG
jgi:hypothetical protein